MASELKDEATGRYLPMLYPEEQPYWEAAKRHELVLQRCEDCHKVQFPIGPACAFCLSDKLRWDRMSGRGTISNVVIFHKGWTPYLQSKVPYAVIQVELEEGPRLTTNLLDAPVQDAKIGMKVEAVWEDITKEISLVQFRPRKE